MIFEELDLDKIAHEEGILREKIAKIKEYEQELKFLKDLRQFRVWYLNDKQRCELQRDVIVNGKPTGEKKNPYATESAKRDFTWLGKYPYLAIRKGFENASKFLSMYGTPERLKKESVAENEAFKKTAEFKSISQNLLRFLKTSEKILPSPSVPVAV